MEEELKEEKIKKEIGSKNEEKNEICIDDANKEKIMSKTLTNEINSNKEKSLFNNKNNLFCVVPWTELCISASNTFQFGAGSKSFKTDNYKYYELWNCKELVTYRNNIVKNDLSLCEKLCRQREDDSNRIKLGLIL